MNDLVRYSFSIEQSLAQSLERMIDQSGYTNRSQFIRDMIRERIVSEEWQEDQEVVGAIILVYDHHASGLTERLMHVQHHHHENVLATTHVHLDEHLCVEMTLMRGKAHELHHLAGLLRAQRGVLHAAVSLSSTGKKLT